MRFKRGPHSHLSSDFSRFTDWSRLRNLFFFSFPTSFVFSFYLWGWSGHESQVWFSKPKTFFFFQMFVCLCLCVYEVPHCNHGYTGYMQRSASDLHFLVSSSAKWLPGANPGGGGVRLGSKASLAALSCSYFEMRIDTYSTCISVAFQTKLSVLKLERQWLLFSEAGVWLCSPGRSGLSLSCLSLPSAGLVGAHHPSALN